MGNAWYLRTQDETFGPETRDRLLEWARLGRIQPGQEISEDGENWVPATEVPFLDMRWSIDIGDGNPRGPFNRQAAQALLASGRLPKGSKMVEVRAPFESPSMESRPPVPPERNERTETVSEGGKADRQIVGDAHAAEEIELLKRQLETLQTGLKAAEKRASEAEARAAEARRQTRVALKAADVAEARMAAVQSEKDAALAAVQADKNAAVAAAQADKDAALEVAFKDLQTLKDQKARKEGELANAHQALKELEAKKEGELANAHQALKELEAKKESELANAHQAMKELEARTEGELAAAKAEVSAAKASEAKYEDRVQLLSEELKRIPPTAQLAADAQAAVYALMKEESEELAEDIEATTRELEELRRIQQTRRERLLARRQEILRHIGTDAEDMTRRALKAHPEDPRTVHMRQELDALRLLQEKSVMESERKIRDLAVKLREKDAEAKRLRQQAGDMTVVYRQLQEARERLQLRERELLDERQHAEEERQQHALAQQSLLNRLSALEMGLPGATNQSREARNVRLAPWMGLKK